MQSKISASGIGELLTGGKTSESYLLKKALENIGIYSELTTKAMEHGLVNQYEAYELFLSGQDNCKWHDEYTPINDYCGASADAIGDEYVYDVKCNYYIDTFLEQVIKLPKKYYYQSQMQMIAEKKTKGCVLLYLTSPEMDMYGNKIEYPYPLEDRHYRHDLVQDHETVERIMNAAEKGYEVLKRWTEILEHIPTKERDEFFYDQFVGGRIYRKLKTASSIEKTIKKAFRCNNEIYYEIR